MVTPLLGTEGRGALATLAAASNPLLAFDFDGTLAPIVAHPGDARIPLPVQRRLAALTSRYAVAIITGRSVSDLRRRLGFEPHHLIGNHGAEDEADAVGSATSWARAFDALRTTLRGARPQLSACGVTVEDKGLSIALHYRRAADPAVARAAIEAVLRDLDERLTTGPGHCVVNVWARAAPDKGDALLALAARCNAGAGLFVGDDVNDESAFAKAPPSWVTVHVGPDAVRSRARFRLDGSAQLPALLQMLLDLRRVQS